MWDFFIAGCDEDNSTEIYHDLIYHDFIDSEGYPTKQEGFYMDMKKFFKEFGHYDN